MRVVVGWGAVVLGLSVASLQACVADAPGAIDDTTDGGGTLDGDTADDATSVDATSSDGASGGDTSPTDGALDAPHDAAPADACTCAAGCNPQGKCLDAVIAIGVGRDHHCILRGDGRVFCMGFNDYGQLGSAPSPPSTTYVEVTASDGLGSPVRFKQLSTGGSSNCAVSLSGDLYCWGQNDYDQLGRDSTTSLTCTSNVPCSPAPAKVDFGGLKVLDVSVGSHRVCAIVDVPTPNPNVRCWGYGGAGEWGTGVDPGADAAPDSGHAFEVTPVPQVVVNLRAKAIHANDTDGDLGGRVCALSEGNIPLCWGATNNRELVSGAEMPTLPICTVAPNDFPSRCVLSPHPFLTAGSPAIDVGAGIYAACALFPGGGVPNKLRCRTATGNYKPVGCGGDLGDIFDVPLPMGVDAQRLSVGIQDLCVIDAKDEVYCLGVNSTLQLGVPGSDVCGQSSSGTDQHTLEFVHELAPGGQPLKADLLVVGTGNVLVYTKAHQMIGWGWAHHGSIGPIPDAAPSTPSCTSYSANGQCSPPRVIPLPPYP